MSQADERARVPDGVEPLTADDRAELERLRRENSALRAGTRPPRRRIRWRSVIAVVLLVLGCVLVPVSLVAVWTHNQVSDTDRFVETVGPLAADPSVQEALTNRITTTVFQYVDVQGLANEAIDALAAQGLRPELAQRMHGLTPTLATAVNGLVRDKVAALVASPQFASAWDQAVRVAHQHMITVLSGNSQTIVVQGDTVYLDLAPFIDAAKQRLSADGLTIVDRIPEVHPTIALAPADQLVRAQTAYSMLDSLATVLPWITLLLLAVGVYLARNRMRALVGTGLGVATSLLVLAAGLLIARGLLVGAVPPAGAPAAAAGLRHHRALPPRQRTGAAGPRAGGGPGRVPGRVIGHGGGHPPVVHRPAAQDPRRPLSDRTGGHLGAPPHARTADRGRRPRGPDLRVPGPADRRGDPAHRYRLARAARCHRVPGPAGCRPGQQLTVGARVRRSLVCPCVEGLWGAEYRCSQPLIRASAAKRLLATST